MRSRQCIMLLAIVHNKKRLEIRVMETGPLMRSIVHIVGSARDSMINLPNGAVVFPCHPLRESGLQITHQKLNIAAG